MTSTVNMMASRFSFVFSCWPWYEIGDSSIRHVICKRAQYVLDVVDWERFYIESESNPSSGEDNIKSFGLHILDKNLNKLA
jgi:hypothetical protein